MSAAWVAGSVRGRLMLEHRAGPDAARDAAGRGSLAGAAALLAGSPYPGALAAATTLEEAERELARSLVLQIRVLAGWLPRDGAGLLRALAGWFEIANIEDRLAYLAGGRLWPSLQLGVLTSVWDAAAQAGDAAEVRRVLRGSSWGEPAGDRPEDILLALRFGWARRVAAHVPEAGRWAAGAAAILLASELFVAGRRPPAALVPASALGDRWPEADSIDALRRRLPARAAWALAEVDRPDELWRAQSRWWRQVEADSQAAVASGWHGRGTIVGVVGLLALDAVRIAAALAVAAGGGRAPAAEALDALC